jgi:hypothetical protein
MEQHKIELLPNAKPIRTKQGRWNPKYSTMVKEELDKLLEARFIRHVETTKWVSLMVLALKKNGKLRVCVNYKALNKITKKDRYPLPFCEKNLEEVARHEMYTFGDGYRGYHQVKIAPEDQLKTTFTTPWGTFCYIVMPFGLCNAPRTFQRLMNKVFELFLGLFLRVFIDDFGVYNDRASHLAKLELVFRRLDGSGVTLSPEKATIGFSEGKMVGHIVFPFPTMKKALQGFLGMVGYYRRFIHMFVVKTHPLTQFLREDAPTPMEDEASRRAFEQLKSTLQVALILRTPDWNKPFLVYCDASGKTVGSTLSQLDENGHDHPIHFASRQLILAEKNYTMTEQKGLVVIFSLKKFRHYLLGYKAKIVTDHKALTYLVNKSNPSGRLVRWLLLMEEFDIDIVHCPGRRHGNVDGLTRAYEGMGDVLEDDDFLDATIMTINADEAPKEYREIIQYLDGMRFPIGATKAIRTQIAHKGRNYLMIGNQLYFQGRYGVL